MKFRRFSPKQRRVLTWWLREGEYEAIICDGAVRSGKTVCMGISFFCWAMARFDGQQFALCAKTIGALRRNLLHELTPVLASLGFSCEEQRSKKTLTVRCGGRENTFYLFGGRDASSAALIQGCTLAGVLFDEAALMPRSFVEQACARCSVSGSRLWFNCNPEGPEHWFYKEWVCKAAEKRLLHLHFTMEDNPALTESVRQRYEKLYTGIFYRRFVLGQWCMAQGLVYDFQKERHVVQNGPEKGRYFISVDYGTQNPFSAGLWCVADGKAWRIKEFYHSGRDTGKVLTDEEYYEKLEELAGVYPVERVIIDPSAASFIATVRCHGRFRVRKAKNGVLPGIRLVAQYLREGRLLFLENCRDTIREFGLYRWEEGKDAPKKENDHAMDDVRYFCTTVLQRL